MASGARYFTASSFNTVQEQSRPSTRPPRPSPLKQQSTSTPDKPSPLKQQSSQAPASSPGKYVPPGKRPQTSSEKYVPPKRESSSPGHTSYPFEVFTHGVRTHIQKEGGTGYNFSLSFMRGFDTFEDARRFAMSKQRYMHSDETIYIRSSEKAQNVLTITPKKVIDPVV
jgi:hypothetical protein